LDVVKLTSYRS